MTTICINGGGFAGLSTALLLAADGHDVTIVERDGPPPSRDPEDAWASWTRRAVPQFRQTHAYLARARNILRTDLPHVWTRLLEAGATEHDLAGHAPATITDREPRPGDDELVYVQARRSTVEHVLRHAVADDPRIDVLDGVAVKGIVTTGDGEALRAIGLATSAGPLEADLVVDCGGRRSAMPDWMQEAGGHRPREVAAEYRIAYWTQWFRLLPGATMPELLGPPALEVGPIEVLRVPADGGWFSITVVATAEDKRFRVLSEQQQLLAFLRRLEITAPWVDPAVAEPVGGILPMFTIVDQRRHFDESTLGGVAAVGDSLAASNPSLARGTSFALMHAIALRDILRGGMGGAAAVEPYREWCARDFEPYWQSTVDTDQAHLARMRAAAAGAEADPDPGWMFGHAAMHDAELWRIGNRVRGVLELPQDAVARPGVLERVGATLERVGPPRLADLDVDHLLAPA